MQDEIPVNQNFRNQNVYNIYSANLLEPHGYIAGIWPTMGRQIDNENCPSITIG